MQIFVTGTDTNIGKTFVTSGLATVMQSLGYKAGVYKPIQTDAIEQNGFLVSADLSFVKQLDSYIETANSYIFKTKCAPVIAAELENTKIDLKIIERDYTIFKENCEVTIVEDSGGLLEPITDYNFMADIPKKLNIPILIIADANSQSISNVLTIINTAKEKDLDIAGVIINKYPQKSADITAKTTTSLIEAYSDTRVLGVIPEIKNFKQSKPSSLINILINNVDIESVFRIKIPKLNLTLN